MRLRSAERADMDGIGDLVWDVRRTHMAYLPQLYDRAQVRWFYRERVFGGQDVVLAELDGQLAGFVAFDADEVHHLYIATAYQGRGIGAALLERACADGRPKQLWVFQQNTGAIRFYERHGFEVVARTDGHGNEERMPDARMRRG